MLTGNCFDPALSWDTANQSNFKMDQSTELTSETHVQRKLSSRQWPSLSVGLFKGIFILIISLTCFAGTIAQNAFPVEFASNPTMNVPLKETLNLTCKFKLVKVDFNNILFKLGATQLYDYKSQGSFKGLQHNHYFSTDPNVDSVFWITLINSFCSDSRLKREYVCWVQNAAREFTEKKVEVSYQGPVLEVKVNDAVLPPPDYSMSLEQCQIDKDVEIKIVVKNLLSAPPNMELSIGEKTLQSKVTPKDDVTLCIYERELIAMYKFPKSGDYKLKYSGPPSNATIKVTIEDEYRGLGGGWIVLIIIVVILVAINLSCVCSFLFCEDKFISRCQEIKKEICDWCCSFCSCCDNIRDRCRNKHDKRDCCDRCGNKRNRCERCDNERNCCDHCGNKLNCCDCCGNKCNCCDHCGNKLNCCKRCGKKRNCCNNCGNKLNCCDCCGNKCNCCDHCGNKLNCCERCGNKLKPFNTI